MRDRTAKNLSTLHAAIFRTTRGRVGKRLVDNDMLLLSTTGRVTGKTHTVPLLYLRDNDDLVVIASWGGRDQHPEWYLNLSADPVAHAQINGSRFRVRATTADTERRRRLWPQVLDAYDGYREYQSRTDREIPVVILSPERQ
ncbi:MAG: nitroreductase family deazaflavin-dependent oxidoreductase [bacterium]|nr:nitroreductase family deazaflavin-dependent oxidoreductase [bacterium]